MDVDVYVAARRGRLIERAIELGCAEQLASEHVDRVLEDQRRRIQKAGDPDPLVHEALARALSKDEPVRRGYRGPLLAAALVAVAAVAGVALTYEPPTRPMPSLFGYDGETAKRTLELQGYDVELSGSPVCEPVGLVVGSWPRTGEQVEAGARVTVYTAIPSGFFCAARYLDRHDAWQFVEFALGGPAPRFADTVYVVIEQSEPVRLTRRHAVRHSRWGGTLGMIADAARAPARTGTRMPQLIVSSGAPPRSACGVARPGEAGRRSVLRLQIDPRRYGDEGGCPLTIDLYRVDRVIKAVVIHTDRAGGAHDTR